MTKLTTHALDTYSGKPAKGMKVDVYFIAEKKEKIKSLFLNNDGRPEEPLVENIKVGNYELIFYVGVDLWLFELTGVYRVWSIVHNVNLSRITSKGKTQTGDDKDHLAYKEMYLGLGYIF